MNRLVLAVLDATAEALYTASTACLIADAVLPGHTVWVTAADWNARAADGTRAAIDRAHRSELCTRARR